MIDVIHLARGLVVIKILIVIPYRELEEAITQTLQGYDLDGLTVTTTHLYGTNIEIIEPLEADIIISRGITATAIAEHKKSSHVISVAISSADLLSALTQAKNYMPHPHIGIITHELVGEASDLSELIECPVSVFQVTDELDVEMGITTLLEKGCTVFVGGLTMTRSCEAKGLAHVHVKSGVQAVAHAIGEAMNAARSLERARMRTNLLTTVLNNAANSMIATNANGSIIAANRQAENLFANAKLEGVLLTDVFNPPAQKEEIVSITGRQFLVSKQIINVGDERSGFLYTFQDTEAISQTEYKIRKELSHKGLVGRYRFRDIVTQNPHTLELVDKARRFAEVPGALLLLGETGTGKELFAQSIHNASPRSEQPFVAVNCAALPEQLLESELFGYTEGAFTGAMKGGKPGLFEIAHKGTLFLDEIGEMPIVVQAKLLRVLQEREIRRIGADMIIPVDVRIVSAANTNILEKVKNGEFRLDLFYRISVLSVTLLPLRERKEDIGILFKHFVAWYCNNHSLKEPFITDEAVEVLQTFYWPGNIRELRNAAERLSVLQSSDRVGRREIEMLDIGATSLTMDSIIEEPNVLEKPKRKISDEQLYHQFIESGLSKQEFADQVRMSRTTLWRKFRKFE